VIGIPEDFTNELGKEPRGTRAIDLIWPDITPSQFMDVYGRPNRLMMPERKGEPNLGQALDILAGVTYTGNLAREGSRLDRLLKSGASNRQIIEEFYEASLSRAPTPREAARLQEAVESRRDSRREALEDCIWALITSREFAYNH
jgi:hypothetical protein